MIVTAAHNLFADSGEARASPGDNLSSSHEEEVPRGATTGIKPLVHRLDHPLLSDSSAGTVEQSLTPPASVTHLIETSPPKADSRFTSVRVSRPGAEPMVYRVPKER
jgi:hypothetical protein